MEKKKLPRNVVVFGFVSFFTDISSEMIYPLIPLFLTSVLGVGASFLGLIEGIAEATASVLKTFSGYISDRVKRRKPLVLLGYGLSTISKPTVGLATRWVHVLIARFLDRTGKGIRTSPRDALIAETVDKKSRGKAFGFHRAMDTLGAVVGPLLAYGLLNIFKGYFPEAKSLRLVFLSAFVPGFIAFVILLLFVTEKAREKRERRAFLGTLRSMPRHFLAFLFVMGIFALGNSSDTFLILRSQNIGFNYTEIPLLYMTFNIIYALSAMPLGSLSDKIGRKATIGAGFAVYGLVYLLFALLRSPSFLWLLWGLYGIYYGFTEGVGRAFVADLVDESRRGTAYGIYHMVIGLLLFPASFIAGILWDRVSPSAPFYFGAFMAFLSAILLLLLTVEKPRAQA